MEDGGNAFPVSDFNNGGNTRTSRLQGMNLRDYFAAAALQAIISKPASANSIGRSRATVAASAYAYADAMIVARQNESPQPDE